jgi:hypothetical protein
MSDLDQVVNLGPPADPGFSDGCPVDAGVGAQFHVVFENNDSRLDDLVIGSVGSGCEPESIAPHDGSVLKDHPVSDSAVLPDRSAGVGYEVVSDSNVGIDGHIGIDRGPLADLDVFADYDVGPDRVSCSQLGRIGDDSRGVNARGGTRGLIKELDRSREVEIGVLRNQRGQFGCGGIGRENNRSGTSGSELFDILGIGKESEIVSLGVFNPGQPPNFQISRAIQPASQSLRNYTEFHILMIT